MNNRPYIVALEIGSSKIVGAIASVSSKGQISVLALDEEQSHESVRYGCIKNLEDTANRIADVIAKLEAHAQISPQRIKSVYTGLSGRSLQSVSHKTSLPLTEGEPVSNEIINRMIRDVTYAVGIEGMEIIDVLPTRYMVDNMESVKPVGSVGNKIEGEFTVILGKEQLKANIRRVISDRNNLEIKRFNTTILAEGEHVLTAEERRLGAMLVNFGAETTTVAIYKKDAPVYLYTMPIGSRNITRDITSLNVLEENAEDIKKSIGNAKEVGTLTDLKIGSIKAIDAGNLIVARAGEIVANIYAQIEAAGLTISDIPEGVIVTGGGCNLKNFVELISDHFGIKARRGDLSHKELNLTEANKRGVDISPKNPSYLSIYSLLLEAAAKLKDGESCCISPVINTTSKVEEINKEPEVNKPKQVKKPKNPSKPKIKKENRFANILHKVQDFAKDLADKAFDDEKDDEDE